MTTPETIPESQSATDNVPTPPKVLPPHYFVLSLLVMFAVGWLDSSQLLPGFWRWLGLLPIGAGVFIAVQGSRLFSRAGTNIIPFSESSALVTDGVFSISRNPMYSGMLLALIGVAVCLNGYLAWLIIVPFFAIIRFFFIANEEILMEQTFAEDYRAYKSKVRRWL